MCFACFVVPNCDESAALSLFPFLFIWSFFLISLIGVLFPSYPNLQWFSGSFCYEKLPQVAWKHRFSTDKKHHYRRGSIEKWKHQLMSKFPPKIREEKRGAISDGCFLFALLSELRVNLSPAEKGSRDVSPNIYTCSVWGKLPSPLKGKKKEVIKGLLFKLQPSTVAC